MIPTTLRSRINADRLLAAPPLMRYFLCLLCGMVASSALPPIYLIFNAFMAFSLFYVLLSSFARRKAFLAGWLFGFGYFTLGLYWIGNALLVEGNDNTIIYILAVVGLPAALALFPALGTYAIRRLDFDLKTPPGFLAFVGVMTLTEYMRGTMFTGFPWNLYGTIWGNNLAVMQVISIIGIYGLTLLTVFWCSAIGYMAISNRKRVSDTVLVLGLLFFALVLAYGTNRLSHAEKGMQPDVLLRVVQPNIAQKDKWNYNKLNENFNTLLRLTPPEAPPAENITTIVVWPETATQSDMTDRADYGSALRRTLPSKSYLVTGILDCEEKADGSEAFNNSIAVFDKNMIRRDIYHKSHLVPFGEYIPLQKYFPLGPIAYSPGFIGGDGPETLHDDEGMPPFSPLICYEIIFPAHVTSPDKNDPPAWIVNVANDGWYGDSTGPHQHLAAARFRAVEEGIPVVRSANTGISAVINAYGETLHDLPLGTRGTIESTLPLPAPEPTVFSRLGNTLFLIMLMATLGLAWILQNRAKALS